MRVYREGTRKWEGPFTISRTAGKQIWVSDGKKLKQFNCTQVLLDTADVANRELSRILKEFQKLISGGIPGICLTETIQPGSPLNNYPAFNFPKAKEMCGLIDKSTYDVEEENTVEEGANVMSGRFVCADKNKET